MARVCVAMSGGVDSTTTAYMLKEAGHDVFGLTMYLFDVIDDSGNCVPPLFLEDAKRVASELAIAHEVIDLRDVFKAWIVDPFVSAYKDGITPNPCAMCNAKIKYGIFMDEALKRGADYMATGHYVRLIRHDDGKVHLHEGNTYRKDQSYFLHGLSQDRLEKLLLPLGEYENKQEIRALADAYQSSVATKKDSLGICFTQGKPPEQFLKDLLGESFGKGKVMDTVGNHVGNHDGYYKFTVGQKKGFYLIEPYTLTHKGYAIKTIDPDTATLVIAKEEELMSTSLTIKQMNWIFKPQTLPYRGEFKIFAWGYRLRGTISKIDDDTLEVEFDQPVRAVAIGQSCVVYNGDEVIGGGVIDTK